MMMTREDYYAQIADMYVQMYESKDKEIEAEDRRFREYLMRSNDRRFREYLMRRNDDDDETDWWYRSEKENPEDQSLNDEELVETEVTTELNGIEDRAVENEANTKMISAKVKEESIPQSKVSIPQSNSEILKSSELGKVDLGLENEEYVVLNENLEQEWVQKKVKTSFEADGDVGKGQKMISDANICCAHKVFVKMPSKEKRIKHLKAWKFKFKPTSKRSKLRDDVFSFVEETAWFKKDPKETIWDCVKKEFKETMAACGKNGGGSLLECIDEESFGDDRPREVIAELNSYTGLTHLDKSDFRRFDGDKIKEWLFKVEEFFSIDFTPMELMVKLASNHFEGDATNWHQSLVQSGQFGQLLTDADYVQQDEFEQVVNHTPFSVVKFGKYKACDALLLLLPSDERFQIKHKWRFRLSHSFSEMKQRVLVSVRKSFGYLMETHGSQYKGLGCVVEKKKLRNVEDGVKQDKDRFSGDVGAKVFMASEELRLLQDVFEMVKELPLKTSLVSPQVMLQTSVSAISEFSDYNNKRMKGTHDEGSLFTLIDSDSTQNFIYPKIAEKLGCEMRFMTSKQKVLLHGMKPGSVGEIRTQKLNRIQDDEVQISMLCVQELPRESVAAVFFLDCNSLVTTISLEEDQKLQGDREPLLTVPDVAAKICEPFDQYIRKKGSVSATRESESNQPTLRFSTRVIEILLNHYMVLLLTHVAYAIQFLGGVGMDKKLFHLSLRNHRVWDPGG